MFSIVPWSGKHVELDTPFLHVARVSGISGGKGEEKAKKRWQRGQVVKALDLQFRGSEFKYYPDRYLDLLSVIRVHILGRGLPLARWDS